MQNWITHVPSSSSLATPSSHPRNNASSPSEVNISAYRSDDASHASASRKILWFRCDLSVEERALRENCVGDVLLLSCMNIDWWGDDDGEGDGDILKGGGVCCGVEDLWRALMNALLPPPLILLLYCAWIYWSYCGRLGGIVLIWYSL